MDLRSDGNYSADKGKHFVLTEKGKSECAIYHNKEVGKPVDTYDYFALKRDIERGYVVEDNIPGWTKLKGYQVVYYNDGNRIVLGNANPFPTLEAAETYRLNKERSNFDYGKIIIEVEEYEGVPLSESKKYRGRNLVDKEHYYGMDAHAPGDYFSDEMVEDLLNALPPACVKSGYVQPGGAVEHRRDKNGLIRPVYDTFKQIDDNVWEYWGTCFKGETPLSNVITRTWKVYGADGHRQRESFNESYSHDWSSGDQVRKIEVLNSDRTGTNEYTIVKITRNTKEECYQELEGQVSDGIFENSRVGKIEEITDKDLKKISLHKSKEHEIER